MVISGANVRKLSFLITVSVFYLLGCTTQPGISGMSASQGETILAELRDLQRLIIEQQSAPKPTAEAAPVKLSDSGNFSLGAADAPVTLFEFADYQCPFCKRFHESSFPELKTKYIDTGKVRYVVRDMPLSFHDKAMPAAIATRCAGAQGKFWPVFNALFAAQALSAELTHQVAIQAGVNEKLFEACLTNPSISKSIEADIAEAERLGVTGTPGFIIAERQGSEFVGSVLLGAQPVSVFIDKINSLLEAHK